MNPNIRALHHMAQRDARRIVGLMSGTSLDGLDVAVCDICSSGETTVLELVAFQTSPYDPVFREEIRRVFARPQVDLAYLTHLNRAVAERHAAIVLDCLSNWQMPISTIDLIASHGQTVMHAPANVAPLLSGAATLQIGDGDHLAVRTGIPTISDFRQKHIAAGGEGAPLAVYGDALLFRSATEPRILLNLGGIANFSALPPLGSSSPVFVTDTGPGNTMLDALARIHRPELGYDRDAELARAGSSEPRLLAALKDDPFFRLPAPKTTGPELFNLDYLAAAQQRAGIDSISPADAMATLVWFSAETIAAEVIRHPLGTDAALYASGGGVHNPLLMDTLRQRLGRPVGLTDAIGIPADAKEAVLFAVLANEAVAGNPGKSMTAMTGDYPAIAMGKLSFAA